MRERPLRLIFGGPMCGAGFAMAFVNAVFDRDWGSTAIGLALAVVGGWLAWSGYQIFRRGESGNLT